jgi:hypothetical protein
MAGFWQVSPDQIFIKSLYICVFFSLACPKPTFEAIARASRSAHFRRFSGQPTLRPLSATPQRGLRKEFFTMRKSRK